MNDPGVPKKHFERRLSALRDERFGWISHWTDLSDYIVPRRGRFLTHQSQPGAALVQASTS